MQNRRKFIKSTTGALLLSGIAFPNLSYSLSNKIIPEPGVQLFTFYKFIDDNVDGTLAQIAYSGIRNIESAFSRKGGYYGYSAKEFSDKINALGMKWRAHHVFGTPVEFPSTTDANGNIVKAPKFKNLQENSSEIIDEALEGGVEYLVAAHLPISTAKEIELSLEILKTSSEQAKRAGIQMVYHNEPADFKTVEGKVPYEVFLNETDADALKFELDFAWAIKGGVDPIGLIDRYLGRFPLWHIKDVDKSFENVVSIGDGTLDNAMFFKHAKKSGLHYYFIEHEAADEPFASITKSIGYLKRTI